MTKKHYQMLADLFNLCKTELIMLSYSDKERQAINDFISFVVIPNLSGILSADNDKFDYAKFRQAINFVNEK
jgi:hypothetical protein